MIYELFDIAYNYANYKLNIFACTFGFPAPERIVSTASHPAYFYDWLQVVSDRALGAQIGNAMSQNVLEP